MTRLQLGENVWNILPPSYVLKQTLSITFLVDIASQSIHSALMRADSHAVQDCNILADLTFLVV